MRSRIVVLLVLVTTGAAAQDRPVIPVSSAAGLYAALADPANDGAIVELAPGTYVLDNAEGHGNLVLRAGMDLVGPNQHRSAVGADLATEAVIDARTLKLFNNGSLPRFGAIQAGRQNTIAGLTVKGAVQYIDNGRTVASVTALIDVNLPPGDAVIRNCVLDGGRRGIRLYGARNAGLVSTVLAEGNVMRNFGGSLGFGFEVQNAGLTASDPVPAHDTTWDVTLRDNLLENNRVGLATFSESPGADRNTISILSMRNVYRDNRAGVALLAGLNGAIGNQEQFVSIDDEILDNVGAPVLGLGGGLIAIAGRSPVPGVTTNDNRLRVQLIGTHFVSGPGDTGNRQGSVRRDITLYGALGTGASIAGTGNTVEILVRQTTSDGAAGALVAADSLPLDASGSSSVTIIGSKTAFERTTEGLEPPTDDDLFGGGS